MYFQRIPASGTCRKIIYTAVLCAALFFSAGPLCAETLGIAVLKNDRFKNGDEIRPFADYLLKQNNKKFNNYKILETVSVKETATALINGSVKMALISAYPAMQIQKHYPHKPDIIATANGNLYIRSYIFVQKESDIKHPADLKGKRIAFAAPYSTGGYYLAAQYLKTVLNSSSYTSIFTNAPDEIFTHVFLKKADAGVTQQSDFEETIPLLYKDTFRIIAETESIPGLFLFIRNDGDKNSLMQSCLTYTSRNTGINSMSPVSFDWKTLFKSIAE